MITRRGRLGLTLTATLVLVWTLTPGPIEVKIKPHKPVIKQGPATYEQKLQNKKLAIRYADLAFGWRGQERACLISLWTRESRFDHYARPLDGAGKPRSTAFGIAQHLGETSRDPATQILRGLRYIDHRYDTPCRANAFQRKHNYY
jgi:hypothetical protein